MMSGGAAFILTIFICVGVAILSVYAVCLYRIGKTPSHLLDVNGLWAGFYYTKEPNRPIIAVWFIFVIGECLSIIGLVIHLILMLTYQETITEVVCFFYACFFFMLLVWPALAVHGAQYYVITLGGLALASLFAFGLFINCIYTWGFQDWKGWILFPLFIHHTFMNLLYWGCSWVPREIATYSISTASECEAQTVENHETRDITPIFTVEEEECFEDAKEQEIILVK